MQLHWLQFTSPGHTIHGVFLCSVLLVPSVIDSCDRLHIHCNPDQTVTKDERVRSLSPLNLFGMLTSHVFSSSQFLSVVLSFRFPLPPPHTATQVSHNACLYNYVTKPEKGNVSECVYVREIGGEVLCVKCPVCGKIVCHCVNYATRISDLKCLQGQFT